jgi:hypothetical protein
MRRNAAAWAVAVVLAASELAGRSGPAPQPGEAAAPDNAEVAAIFQEDQSDRKPAAGAAIDWSAVAPKDRTREARVSALLAAGALRTGKDYFSAAVVLQHGPATDSRLLAHDLSIVAVTKEELYAKWLVAATEDRFLTEIGRPQRFRTQYRSDGPGRPLRLYDVDPSVTDGLGREFGVPPLEEARRRETAMNQTPTPAR